VQINPRDTQAFAVMAGWATLGTGQYERGIQAAQVALRLGPGFPFGYVKAWHYLLLDRYAEAADVSRQAAEHKLEIQEMLVTRYYLAFLSGDQAGMDREIARARGTQGVEERGPTRHWSSPMDATWNMPRRLRCLSRAILPNRKRLPPICSITSPKILPCNSATSQRCTRFPHWLTTRLRMLLIPVQEQSSNSPMTVVVNWQMGLKK
jgi:hypothetical protein